MNPERPMHEPKYMAIDPDDNLDIITYQPQSRGWQDRTVRLSTLSAILTVNIVAWLALVLWLVSGSGKQYAGQNCGNTIGYYPAAEAVRYYETTFVQDRAFKTSGDVPSPETDKVWRDLQEPVDGMIEASQDDGFDLSRLQHSITSAVDNRYHMYGLEVFHQLHCLDRIRQSFYPSHYFPNDTQEEIIHHREHCIEHLRQSVMCSGDISLDRWYWDKDAGHSYLATDVPHVCRDFDMLSDWVKKYRYRPQDWLTPDLLEKQREEDIIASQTG